MHGIGCPHIALVNLKEILQRLYNQTVTPYLPTVPSFERTVLFLELNPCVPLHLSLLTAEDEIMVNFRFIKMIKHLYRLVKPMIIKQVCFAMVEIWFRTSELVRCKSFYSFSYTVTGLCFVIAGEGLSRAKCAPRSMLRGSRGHAGGGENTFLCFLQVLGPQAWFCSILGEKKLGSRFLGEPT